MVLGVPEVVYEVKLIMGPRLMEYRVCNVISGRIEAEASYVVITSIVSVCQGLALVLFNPRSNYSYLSTYFALNINGVHETPDVPIYVFTLVSESLVVDCIYQGCIVIYLCRKTQADLIMLDMVDFNVVLGIYCLSPHHTILDCYPKTVNVASSSLPHLVWTNVQNVYLKRVISYVHVQCLMDRGYLSYLAYVWDCSQELPSFEDERVARESSWMCFQ